MFSQAQQSPESAVIQLFNNTDAHNWDGVRSGFAEEVQLDYSSLNGSPAARLKPEQIVASWKAVLPGFEFTHHQIGNLLAKTNDDTAHVFCYGTASHYLAHPAGNLWTVVGSYDFDLKKTPSGRWIIQAMKFNFKYQEGNTALIEKAIERLKSQSE
jgi:hypothetical protein